MAKEVMETEEEIRARKESDEYKLVQRNALSIGQTLEHHGKILDDLFNELHSAKSQIAMMQQEMVMQKNMIVKSLAQKYGTGSTA